MIEKRPNGRYAVRVFDPKLGKKRSFGTFDRNRDARQAERKALDAVGYMSDETVASWAERWKVERPRLEPTTNQHNAQQIKAFVAEYGSRQLWSITRHEAREWARKHPHQAKALGAMFNDALDVERIGRNPFANLKIGKGRGRKDINAITLKQLEQLTDACSTLEELYRPVFRTLVVVAAYTGCRPGELFALRWEDVDLQGLEVSITKQTRADGTTARTKTKASRRIVLPPPARDALLTLDDRDGLVFRTANDKPLRRGSHLYYWHKVRAAAGMPKLDFYELRHFAASFLADKGYSSHDIAHQLGNSVRVVEDTYIHAYTDDVNERIKRAFGTNVEPLDTGVREASNG